MEILTKKGSDRVRVSVLLTFGQNMIFSETSVFSLLIEMVILHNISKK